MASRPCNQYDAWDVPVCAGYGFVSLAGIVFSLYRFRPVGGYACASVYLMIPRLPQEYRIDSPGGNSGPSLCSQGRLLQCRPSVQLGFPTSPSVNRRKVHARAVVLVHNSAVPANPGDSQEAKPGWSHRVLKAARVFFGLIAVFVACDVLHFLGGSRPPTGGQAWHTLAASEENCAPGTPSERRQPIIIYDRHKRIIAKFANSAVIALSELPDHVWQSVVSAEDRTFFRHPGLDVKGLARAVLFAGTRGGGSTITQQLVKNLFVSDSKTISRKVFEMAIAVALEVHSTKIRILETYLQTAYFGHGAFGIGDAANTYYQKMPQNLTLNEAALLAATLPSPETLSPFRDPEGSVKRLEKVLKAMHGMGWLSDARLQSAVAEGLPVSLAAQAQPSKNPGLSKYFAGGRFRAPFFVEEVMKQLQEITGGRCLQAGMHVYTTADLRLQEHAERVLRSDVAMHPPGPAVGEAALVAVEPGSGAVRVLVGGRDYSASQYNRASYACRPSASVFKPAVYLAALERRLITPSSLLPDQPLNYARRVRKDTSTTTPFSFISMPMIPFQKSSDDATSLSASVASDGASAMQTAATAQPEAAPVTGTMPNAAAQASKRQSLTTGGMAIAVSLSQPESGGEWVCTSTACPLSEVSPTLQPPRRRQRRSPTRSQDFFREAGEYDVMRLSAKYRRQIQKSATTRSRTRPPYLRGMASISGAASHLMERCCNYEKIETRLIAAYQKAHRGRFRDPRHPMYGIPVVRRIDLAAGTSGAPVRNFYSVQQPAVPHNTQTQAVQPAEQVLATFRGRHMEPPPKREFQAEEQQIGGSCSPFHLVIQRSQQHGERQRDGDSAHSSQKNMWEVVRRSTANGAAKARTAAVRNTRHVAEGHGSSTRARQLTPGNRPGHTKATEPSRVTAADSHSMADKGHSARMVQHSSERNRVHTQSAAPDSQGWHQAQNNSVAVRALAAAQIAPGSRGTPEVEGTVQGTAQSVTGHTTVPTNQEPSLPAGDQDGSPWGLLMTGHKDRNRFPGRLKKAADVLARKPGPTASPQTITPEKIAGQLSSHRIPVQEEAPLDGARNTDGRAQNQDLKSHNVGPDEVVGPKSEHPGPRDSFTMNIFMPWRGHKSKHAELPAGTGVVGLQTGSIHEPREGVASLTQHAADDKGHQQSWTANMQKSSLTVLPQRPKQAASASSQSTSDDRISYDYQIVEEYLPTNVTSQFAGVVTARTALKKSLNAPAVALAYEVGLENVRCCAEALGLPMLEAPTLSMALGTNCVTPLQVAAAYATIAARGLAAEPFFVRLVKDSHGSTIFRHKKKTRQVARRAACDQLTSMLKDAFKNGTAASAKRFCPRVSAAAKTGTSDECRDGWLAGYTGSLATVVWVGRDDNGPLSGTASRVAAPMWGKFMAAI